MRKTILNNDKFQWIDLAHPKKEELAELQEEFNLHPSYVQDCMDPTHLPKIEQFGVNTFLIVRIYDEDATSDSDSIQLLTRKIAFFIGPHFIITIHRLDSEQFESLVARCMKDQEEFDQSCELPSNPPNGTTIMLRFLNRALRSYHIPIEKDEDEIYKFESALFSKETSTKMMQELHVVRRRLSLIKRILLHSRDVVNNFIPGSDQNNPFYFDLKENVSTLIFLTDESLDDVTSLLNLQFNLITKKTNEVMRILTVFSVFFLPLNFIAGIYGMNFENIPELKWQHGYYFALATMGAVTFSILFWSWRKGWLRSED